MSAWNAQEVETACTLWREGKSASEIARVLPGRTRNAVIGQLHRIGLSMPVRQAAQRALKPRVCRPPKPNKPPVMKATPKPAQQPVVSLAYARPFMSRASRECAWLLDDGRSCCAPTVSGGSWCGAHAALVYRPTAKFDGEKMARRFG